MTLKFLLPMEMFGGSDEEHFGIKLTVPQAGELLATICQALEECEDIDTPPLDLFKLSKNSNN